MIYAITCFAYPAHHCAQDVALGPPFHDRCCGGPVSPLAFDEAKEDPIKTLGLSGDYDKDQPFVLPVPRHKDRDFDSPGGRMERNGMLERAE